MDSLFIGLILLLSRLFLAGIDECASWGRGGGGGGGGGGGDGGGQKYPVGDSGDNGDNGGDGGIGRRTDGGFESDLRTFGLLLTGASISMFLVTY